MKTETLEQILRKELAQTLHDHYVGLIKDVRAAHEKRERGEISTEDFERYEETCNHLIEVLEAAVYSTLHGPKKEFSKLIRIRKERGLTQAEAARKAGMSLAWYALLEQGFKEKVSAKQKEKVARMLEVPYVDLFGVAWWGKKDIDKMLKEHPYSSRPDEQ
ncbi:MAG: helix-turn-helix transcriptional regulator [Acidobacteria bacterium]|nr:helix-turn-helix transcriptional regulator [Acidobacteriota bacterium]